MRGKPAVRERNAQLTSIPPWRSSHAEADVAHGAAKMIPEFLEQRRLERPLELKVHRGLQDAHMQDPAREALRRRMLRDEFTDNSRPAIAHILLAQAFLEPEIRHQPRHEFTHGF